MFKQLERAIEWLLWKSRLIIFLSVISAIVSAIILILIGSYDVIIVIQKALHSFESAEAYESLHRTAIIYIISSIDFYLIATVLFIFGIGLYELFISKIEYAEQDTCSSKILVIHTLDQLKEKLAKVIIMVLIVTFFKHAVNYKYENILSLLYLSIGIGLISGSIYLMSKGQKKEED